MTALQMTDLSDLAHLVSVQPEATVSRTVLRAEGTNVVLFAFDAGEELREHTAALPVLLQTLEGAFDITAAGRTVGFATGLAAARAAASRSASARSHCAYSAKRSAVPSPASASMPQADTHPDFTALFITSSVLERVSLADWPGTAARMLRSGGRLRK